MKIEGIATALSFHRVVVTDPAFVAADGNFAVHTRWIETEFNNQIQPYAGGADVADEAATRETVVVEVNGKRVEVSLPANYGTSSTVVKPVGPGPKRKLKTTAAAATGDSVTAPMQGTVVKVAVTEGQKVKAGETVVVLEAMKMEQPLTAHKDGIITNLNAEVGGAVSSGTVICELKDLPVD
jgi:acetyl-CoA/propionyl-CoA carboxylase biotin carboxyl carrier protein